MVLHFVEARFSGITAQRVVAELLEQVAIPPRNEDLLRER